MTPKPKFEMIEVIHDSEVFFNAYIVDMLRVVFSWFIHICSCGISTICNNHQNLKSTRTGGRSWSQEPWKSSSELGAYWTKDLELEHEHLFQFRGVQSWSHLDWLSHPWVFLLLNLSWQNVGCASAAIVGGCQCASHSFFLEAEGCKLKPTLSNAWAAFCC